MEKFKIKLVIGCIALCAFLWLLLTVSPSLESMAEALDFSNEHSNEENQLITRSDPHGLNTKDVLWSAQIDVTETLGETDYVIAQEATDSWGGPPPDPNDSPNPPTSPGQKLDAYFDDGLSIPYTRLIVDSRFGPDPDYYKEFNLTVVYSGSTNIIMSWDPADFKASEYQYVNLTDDSYVFLADMKTETSYSFSVNFVPLNFHIICEKEKPSDVGVTSINLPTATIPIQKPADVQVTVKNFGVNSLTNVPVNVQIVGTTYDEDLLVNLDFAEELVVDFPDWTPTATGIFTINAETQLLGDDDPTNDDATATVEVNNTSPIAHDDSASCDEDGFVWIQILENDSDDTGLDESSVKILIQPDHGSLFVNSSTGDVKYVPVANFSGTDSFSYTVNDTEGLVSNEATVTITVIEVNDPPVAQDDSAETLEDVGVWIAVLGNDSDSDGFLNVSSVQVINGPDHGSTSVNLTTGEILFTPVVGFNGMDSFSYTVEDDQGLVSNEAVVTVFVESMNSPPLALNDSNSTVEDMVGWFDVVANDVDSDGSIDVSSVVIVSGPSHGSVMPQLNGTVRYVPDADFFGSDSFVYSIADDDGAVDTAVVNVTVVEVNDAPVADFSFVPSSPSVLDVVDFTDDSFDVDGLVVSWLWDFDDGNMSTLQNPSYQFGNPGEYMVTLNVTDDDGDYDLFSDMVQVSDVNYPPVAVDDSNSTVEDMVGWFDVVANDVDSDGSIDVSSVVIVSGPSHGSVMPQLNGTVRYVPDADFFGSDSFVYSIADDDGAVDTAVVNVTVVEVNDAPVADFSFVPSSPSVLDVVDFTDDSFDVDGSVVSWLWDFDDGNMSTLQNPSHRFDEAGTFSVSLTVTDDDGASDTIIIHLSISLDVNDEIITVNKMVKPDCLECEYVDNISFDIGADVDIVNYKVDIHVDDNGNFNEPILNLSVKDSLPQLSGLIYNDSFIWSEDGLYFTDYVVSITDNFIFWNFTVPVYPGDSFFLYYCADVIGCGDFENSVNVSAMYFDGGPCCPEFVYDVDDAFVDVICGPGLEVVKEASVDGLSWSPDNVESVVGGDVWFRITVKNTGYEILEGVNVFDSFPCFLEFGGMLDDGGADYVDTNCENESYDVRWFFSEVDVGEVIVIKFFAEVIDVGCDVNLVTVHDCPDPGDNVSSDSDTVEIIVEEGMFVQKKVYNPSLGAWVKNVSAAIGDEVNWNVTTSFYSADNSVILHHININDTLPDGLSYVDGSGLISLSNGSSFVSNPVIDGNCLLWELDDLFLLSGDWIKVTFRTIVNDDVDTGLLKNKVNVNGNMCNGTSINDDDHAFVFICPSSSPLINCEKWVQAENGTWVDEINAEIGDIVTFNISIANQGPASFYGLTVLDILPESLNYREGSAELHYFDIVIQSDQLITIVNNQDNTLLWTELNNYVGAYLAPGEKFFLLFEASVTGPGILENRVNVSGCMCSHCIPVFGQDSAVVNVSINSPPVIQNPSPADNAKKVNLNPTLSVDVSDVDEERLTIQFYDADTDQLLGTDVCNGNCTASIGLTDLNENTDYSWYVIVSDGLTVVQSDVFTFTTKMEDKDIDVEISISGGFGITVDVVNNGMDSVENVNWQINIQNKGILNRVDKTYSNQEDISAGSSLSRDIRLFNIGQISIDVTVTSPDLDHEITKQVHGFLLGFFVFL